ncbi:hypothetical protein AWZ03_012511 [Drosophila navojoa]|uniref:Uncharacterized protein n=1 Tax=Drosophila navojoa TaxID=7232 RepID=A0A484AXC9_DRONA|nr:hypothetical protein AWZ03_012511 [Drosophila navojoa]
MTLAFLNLSSNVNAHGNQCMHCKDKYKPCKVTSRFLKILRKVDEKKLVKKTADDPADPNLDNCLHPGYKLIDTLNFTICSGSSDGLYGASGTAIVQYSTRDMLSEKRL